MAPLHKEPIGQSQNTVHKQLQTQAVMDEEDVAKRICQKKYAKEALCYYNKVNSET